MYGQAAFTREVNLQSQNWLQFAQKFREISIRSKTPIYLRFENYTISKICMTAKEDIFLPNEKI